MKQKNRSVIFATLLSLVLILLLLFAGCGKENPATENALTSVIPDGKGDITVKAVLTDGFLDSYLEKKVYLFELPSHVTVTEAELSELDPIAEANPKAEITFTVSETDGTRSRLFSSFLMASYDGSSRTYTPITPPLAVTDLSDMTPAPAKEKGETSIKGLISDHPTDAIRLGISHTILDVPMEKLILSGWQEEALAYIYNGETAYLYAPELQRLDDLVEAYTAAGVTVYLRFVLGNPANGRDVPACLYTPTDAAVLPGETHYPIHMDDPAAATIMEGFFDFMAERYASPEREDSAVTAFMVGDAVNTLRAGGSVAGYEKLVRVAHTALLSHNANGRVYLSLNSLQTAAEGEEGLDIPTFLQEFREVSELRGSFDWHLSCELYTDTPRIWDKQAETDARYYTIHSLESLTDLLANQDYTTRSGETRRLLISGFSVPAAVSGGESSRESHTQQAASYAFAYLSCVKNGRVEALIYDHYADTEESRRGIWMAESRDGEWVITQERPLYGIFKQVDTTAMTALTGGLSAIIDEPYNRLEQALAGKEPPVTFLEGNGALEAFSPEHEEASPLFVFDGGSLCGFADGGALTYMELTRVEVPDTVILYNRFARNAVCDPMGITTAVSAAELIGAQQITVDLYAGAVKSGEAEGHLPSLTLRMIRRTEAGTMIYEASAKEIRGGVWQSAVFDVEAFTSGLKDSEEIVLTLSMDYDPADGVTCDSHMGIMGIYTSAGASSGGISRGWILWIVGGAAILVIAGFALLMVKNRKISR